MDEVCHTLFNGKQKAKAFSFMDEVCNIPNHELCSWRHSRL